MRKRGKRISSKLILGFSLLLLLPSFLFSKMTKQITEFQKRVYEIVKKVPKGKTTTYKAIAEKLNSSPRAVGQALKVNPYSYAARGWVGGRISMSNLVPCHRVIKSNGEIGGYSGSNPKNIKKKIALLKKEGAI